MPLLLHDYLERGARTQPHNRELQQLMQEQRQTNLLLRRLLYVAIGFVAGMMAIVLLPRLLLVSCFSERNQFLTTLRLAGK